MKVFLAGVAPWRETGLYDDIIKQNRPYILESFYYANTDTERLIPYYGDFLLDSGAFTFCASAKGINLDVLGYIDRLADFIVKNNVRKFFELDLDGIYTYEEVLEFRRRLEARAGRQSIPVFHVSRGKDAFVEMCKNYKYVALGGFVAASKTTKKEAKMYQAAFPWFIETAHKYGAQIHGLGFTSPQGIKKYHFDSVDSTSWTTGNRFGTAARFNGKDIIIYSVPHGHKIADTRKLARHNFAEWVKFQKYADTHL